MKSLAPLIAIMVIAAIIVRFFWLILGALVLTGLFFLMRSLMREVRARRAAIARHHAEIATSCRETTPLGLAGRRSRRLRRLSDTAHRQAIAALVGNGLRQWGRILPRNVTRKSSPADPVSGSGPPAIIWCRNASMPPRFCSAIICRWSPC